MKNATISLLLAVLTFASYAQDSLHTFKIKDYSLRDYVAPDIKFQRLEVTTDMNGSGNQRGAFKSNRFSGNGGLGYSNYINLLKFQGRSNAGLWVNTDFNKTIRDTVIETKNVSTLATLYYQSENRWYNSNDIFSGVHPSINYSIQDGNMSNTRGTVTNTSLSQGHDVDMSVFLTIGRGRIQPVTAARQAMDILISLEKYNRLAKSPSALEVDSLAKIANRVIFKRFYDKRFKRIYQLEALDKGIQEMGLVSNTDMVYAANLSDVWGYGRLYSRGSGSRLETGLIPVFGYNYTRTMNPNSDNVDEGNYYGGYGFVSWLKQVPLSYAWQSNFAVDLSAGIRVNNGNYLIISTQRDTVKMVSQMLNVSYELGYYPNTRTEITVRPFVGLSANQTDLKVDKFDFFGLSSGVNLKAYYYVSPRFRLGLTGGATFISDEYLNQSPFPSRVLTSNGNNSAIRAENNTGKNIFQYNYRLKISYAIF